MGKRSSQTDVLTTGEVAALLGTTLQHVVNLCDRGELPYTLAGTHRRILRADAEAFRDRGAANRGGPMTEDQIRSLWIHRAVLAKVTTDPGGTLAAARDAIERSLARDPNGAQRLRQWLQAIDRGPEAVMRIMTSTDPLARELRQNSPFPAMLSTEQREDVLRGFREAHRTRTHA